MLSKLKMINTHDVPLRMVSVAHQAKSWSTAREAATASGVDGF